MHSDTDHVFSLSLAASVACRYNPASEAVDSGYPKSISSGWPGIPDDIDTVSIPSNSLPVDYLYVSAALYRYSPISLQAFIWSNNRTYFFKGGQYYRWNTGTNKVDSGYPAAINSSQGWPGVPDSPDAGFLFSDNGEDHASSAASFDQASVWSELTVASVLAGKTYFFK